MMSRNLAKMKGEESIPEDKERETVSTARVLTDSLNKSSEIPSCFYLALLSAEVTDHEERILPSLGFCCLIRADSNCVEG